MIYDERIEKVLYGGDYNPEQWSEDVWEEDMRLFALAGIDIVTLNVFSWASLQPDEHTYCFEKLDKIMDLVEKNGLKVCMATSTAAHPAWMAKKYPDILRTEFNGMKRKFGSRHNSCQNSPTYQKYSVLLAKKLAERYKDRKCIVAWHVSNEYGGECYCENCEKAFRVWLKDKYKTIEELNRAWNTAFWGHTFYEWDEIVLPNLLSEHFAENRTTFQGISLDYRRFNSEGMLHCFKAEYEAIKSVIPDAKITTNLMGFYKPLDYQMWANEMDFISWDNYPANEDPYARIAMNHDLMRGIKGGQPFVLMEQTPSVTNWLAYNALKRPNVMRLWSYQAMAHGADAIMFFQMRRSIGACEKYHGAVIDHVGNENTRVFREIAKLGEELKQLGSKTLGSTMDSKVAVVVDWDNWWALEYSAGPSCDLKYLDEVFGYYRALEEQNYSVDLIGVNDDLSKYEVVIAPILYMTKGSYDEKIREYVKNGGTFITTFFSGIVDEHDLVITGGYPGHLRDILGIWVEEIDALPAGTTNAFTYEGKEYEAKLLCDIMHLEGAKALATYEKDFYANTPVLTVNEYGKGKAYYVGTRSSEDFYQTFLKERLEEKGIQPVLEVEGVGIEATERIKGDEHYLFVLNHNDTEGTFVMPKAKVDLLTGRTYTKGEVVTIPAKEVMILEG
ncbi:MAG TPA: beta-galactosidase [Candidatus Scybalomonas excrementigallinarum]|nr:beta-galactosidase [Candidatus Scybalomonas excrementigallinarum]